MSGGAGKALRGGGARRRNTSPAAQVKDGGHGRPPHPRRVVAGQIYWPRTGGTRRHQLTVVRVGSEGRVTAKRTDGSGAPLTLSAARLLCAGDDGQGRFYSFVKWSPRRYKTWALTAAVNSGEAVLVLPEWHPGRPVTIAHRLLPVGARDPGDWLTLTADLSKPTAAGLEVAPIAATEPPSDLPEVRWRPASERSQRPKPLCGPGCGDIVLEQVQSLDEHTFFVRERPAELESGGRVYLALDAEVVGFLVLRSWRISPNGLRIACEPPLHPLEPPLPIDGQLQTERWRWRWWHTEHGQPNTRTPTRSNTDELPTVTERRGERLW